MKIIHRSGVENCTIPQWNLDPVLTRIFATRGIKDTSELVYHVKDILPPNLKDIEVATTLICDAILAQQRIRIIGDYDTDGATSTALAMRFFKDIGYQQVDYYIPDRQTEGYGLNLQIVEHAKQQGVALLITVDNGIAALEAVAYAKKLGLQVVVTDHHLPTEQLPPADAIVNPQQKGCTFASKNIAGVGVIFYVLTCVRTQLRTRGYFVATNLTVPNMTHYLDLVAIGTVADVVPMDYNNRLMVSLGINLIRQKNTSLGLCELIRIAGRSAKTFTSIDIGFSLSPRLNAAGRVGNMRFSVDCLLSSQEQQAKSAASLLQTFNLQRRDIEKDMLKIAQEQIQQVYGNYIATGIVLYDPRFHLGVSGIVANKVKEQYNVPVIVLANTAQSGVCSGSARSIGEYHIKDALARIDQQAHLDLVFGGHKLAAGLTLNLTNLSTFRQVFGQDVDAFFHGQFPEVVYETDGQLGNNYFCSSFARAITYDHPWGEAFPAPKFDGEFELYRQFVVNHQHLRVILRLSNGQTISGMYFNFDHTFWPNRSIRRVRAVYQFNTACNSDDTSFSLIIRAMEPVMP